MAKQCEIQPVTIMTGIKFSTLDHVGAVDLQRLAVLQRELYREDLPLEVRKWMENEVQELIRRKKRGENYDN